MPIINRVLVGEGAVGEGYEAAHVDVIIGPPGSAAEDAFCLSFTNQKKGGKAVLATLEPNLMVKPATVMFNKVTIRSEQQAARVFGPAQRAVAMAVVDCVEDGTIPSQEADDVYLCVGVFLATEAQDDKKIQDNNYEATKLAIKRAINREPKAQDVIGKKADSNHPFAPY